MGCEIFRDMLTDVVGIFSGYDTWPDAPINGWAILISLVLNTPLGCYLD